MDATSGNSYPCTGGEILFFENTDVAPHTVTISSTPDQLGRSDASLASYSIPAGGFALIQMSQLIGWQQSGQLVFLATSSASVKIAVLRKN
jgi:hypothetical protein